VGVAQPPFEPAALARRGQAHAVAARRSRTGAAALHHGVRQHHRLHQADFRAVRLWCLAAALDQLQAVLFDDALSGGRVRPQEQDVIRLQRHLAQAAEHAAAFADDARDRGRWSWRSGRLRPTSAEAGVTRASVT
jgi:hypothetical protein